MIVTTAAEIRLIEEKENEVGTQFLALMERAGTGCAGEIMQRFRPDAGPVAVLCGSGKNGGDGFVIARKLLEANYDVCAILAFGPPKAEDTVVNHKRAEEAWVPVLSFGEPEAAKKISDAAVLVDCMFGIGFRGAANETQAEVFEALNDAAGTVVAVDVPSGVVTDTGEVLGPAVKADLTIAISTLKPLHVLYPAREYCRQTILLDIGITEEAFAAADPHLLALNDAEAAVLLPPRARTAHKNNAGHVLSVCGSYRMPGAACLCANAAVRAGAGLVTAAYPGAAYPAISSHLTECMSLPLPDDPAGRLNAGAVPELKAFLPKASAVAAGCGLGQSEDLQNVLAELLKTAECPVVLDADALNNIAARPSMLKEHRGPVVLTPHPGEMARLTGKTVPEIEADRRSAAKALADEYGVTVLLKGPDTVVASADSEDIYVNLSGNQGLAKGGSGDTLSGILAAFLAQGMEPQTAAACAAFYHGLAAEHCAETMSLRSICASDLIDALPVILP